MSKNKKLRDGEVRIVAGDGKRLVVQPGTVTVLEQNLNLVVTLSNRKIGDLLTEMEMFYYIDKDNKPTLRFTSMDGEVMLVTLEQ